MHTESFPYRLADYTWHRVALSISGAEIQLLVDCRPLYKRVMHFVPDRNFSASNLQLFIGQRNSYSHSLFKVIELVLTWPTLVTCVKRYFFFLSSNAKTLSFLTSSCTNHTKWHTKKLELIVIYYIGRHLVNVQRQRDKDHQITIRPQSHTHDVKCWLPPKNPKWCLDKSCVTVLSYIFSHQHSIIYPKLVKRVSLNQHN